MKLEAMHPNTHILEQLWVPGSTVRPYGYMSVQTDFALKAFKLGLAPTIIDALEQFTAIPRKIMGNKESFKAEGSHWQATARLLEDKPNILDHEILTDTIFAKYLSFPDASTYKPFNAEKYAGKQAGAYTHDYDEKNHAIRLHFLERIRGPVSEFGTSSMEDRISDMEAMIRLIHDKHYSPEPTILTSGSWMYNIPSIIGVMPDFFKESATAPPRLSLVGDSMWGQFVTSEGGDHLDRCAEFTEKLARATDLESMIASLPFKVLFLQAPLEDFYDHYHVE